MSPLEATIDPVWLIIVKVVILFVILLAWTIFNVWFERRVLAKMQNRIGPIMNSAWAGGVFQAVGDGLKLIFKEMLTPKGADKIVFNLAPVIAGIACFASWSVIPLGGQVSMFGHTTRLQITDVPVAVLFILAVASIGIYGVVLAGWSSAGTYSLLLAALQCSDDLLRGRDGPVSGDGVHLLWLDVDVADRRVPGKSPGRWRVRYPYRRALLVAVDPELRHLRHHDVW